MSFATREYLAVTHLQADALITFDSELAAKVEKVVRVGSIKELVKADK